MNTELLLEKSFRIKSISLAPITRSARLTTRLYLRSSSWYSLWVARYRYSTSPKLVIELLSKWKKDYIQISLSISQILNKYFRYDEVSNTSAYGQSSVRRQPFRTSEMLFYMNYIKLLQIFSCIRLKRLLSLWAALITFWFDRIFDPQFWKSL